MLDNLPIYISLIFGLTTLLTLFMFHVVVANSGNVQMRSNATKITLGLTIWLTIQAILTLQNIYNSNTKILPPPIFLFGVLPTLITMAILFLTPKGRDFIDSLSLVHYTYLNIIRIPAEIVLWLLYIQKCIPELMTFEGRNFDIIAGISAPFMAYFGIKKGKLLKRSVLVWNIICLGLLMNIVFYGFLSAPTPLQKFAFDQPNIALLNFPFSWLVSFIVPIVLFGHLTSIRQLLNHKTVK